jgi:hypothetical protein
MTVTDAAVKAAPVSPSEAGRTAEPAKADARARFERQMGVGEGSITGRDRALKEQRAEKSPPRDEPEWLIAPRVSPDGRDSLGRGLDAQSVSAFVANDKAVQRERQALSTWLQTAYRDPREAGTRLDALVARDGFASSAPTPARPGYSLAPPRERCGRTRNGWWSRSGRGSRGWERRRVQARAIIARTSSGNCRRMRPGRQSFRSARGRRSTW